MICNCDVDCQMIRVLNTKHGSASVLVDVNVNRAQSCSLLVSAVCVCSCICHILSSNK